MQIRINLEIRQRFTHAKMKFVYGGLWVDISVHTSDIRMIDEYIRIIYEHIRATYEWHTNDIQVHMMYIQMACEWHTNDKEMM